MRVEVYRNLRTNTWSVREVGGVVVDHPARLALRNPEFVVRPGGRDGVREQKRKNVRAFVRGEVTETRWEGAVHLAVPITYNPYKHDTFVDPQGNPVHQARFAYLDDDFVVYAFGIY